MRTTATTKLLVPLATLSSATSGTLTQSNSKANQAIFSATPNADQDKSAGAVFSRSSVQDSNGDTTNQ